MTSHMIRNAVDELHQAFAEFRQANDHRLCQLEAGKGIEQAVEEKVNRLNEGVEKAHSRLSRLETAAQRPFFAPAADEEGRDKTGEQTAFFSYIRKGMDDFEQKALTSLSDASGGYLVPPAMLTTIHSTLESISPLRSLARVTHISTDALELLHEKGAAEVGWVAETEERPETATPELRKIRIPVHQIYAKPRASQKLLDDASVDIESWLAHKIAEKMALAENAAFINGDGKGKPRGFMTYESAEVGKGEWGKLETVFAKSEQALIEGDVLIETFHALKAPYLKGAVWLMGRSALAAIRKLKDAQGHYLWQPALAENMPASLMGYPVVIADDMPVLQVKGTARAIAFGNFREAYQIVDRAGLHVLRDPFSAKPYVEFYATKRLGGDVINFDALKLIHLEGRE